LTRGEIWWARLAPPAGHRPVLLVSRNTAYASRQLFMVAPITTQIRGIRAEVALGPEDGLRRRSVANLDTLATIRLDALEERIGQLRPEKIRAVNDALRYALDLDEPVT